MGSQEFTKEEEAEVLRKQHLYRRLILSGRLVLSHASAAQLVGPDCMYHLYSLQHSSESGRRRDRSARKPSTSRNSLPLV